MKLRKLLVIILSIALCLSAFAGIAVSAAANATILGEAYDYERKANDYYSSAASWNTYTPETEGVEGWVYPTNGAAERIYNIAAPVTAFSIRVIALDKTAASAVTVFLSKDNSAWVDSKATVEGYSAYDGDYEVYNLVSYPDANAEYKFIKVCVPTDGNKTGILGLAYNTVYTGEKATSYDKVISAAAETPAEIELGTVGNSQWKVADWWGNYWYNYDADILDENNNTENYGYLIFKSAAPISDFSLKLSVRQELTRLSLIKVYGSSDKENWTPIYYNFTELVSYGNDSVGYRYRTDLYSDVSNCNYTYIKLDLTDCDEAYQGVYPGVYSVRYNYKSVTDTTVTGMADSYDVSLTPTAKGTVITVPGGVELLSYDDTYSWYADDQDGLYWYNSNKSGNTVSSKGYVIFTAGTYFEDFALKLHTLNNTSEVEKIKIYASNDKSLWLPVDYNYTTPVKGTYTDRYYSYLYASLLSDYKYIKVDLSGYSASWNSVYPGIYSFQYNQKAITENDAEMVDIYASKITPTENTDKAELIAEDGYQWSSMEWYQKLWYAWDGISANSTSYTKGSIVFDAGNRIENFRIGFHILSDNAARLDGIKIYASNDKADWLQVDYKISETNAVGDRFKIYLYADLLDAVDYRYIKLEMNPTQTSWHGIDPGVYGFEYNSVAVVDSSSTMADSYTTTISPDANTDKAELIGQDGYEWKTMDWYGNLWYTWDGVTETANTKGSIVFTADEYIDNFRIRFHLLSDDSSRLNGIKVYASSDKSNWVNVDYKISETTAAGNRYKIYLYADLAEQNKFSHIKLVMNPAQTSWHGIDPGVYGFEYNAVSIVNSAADMKSEYSSSITPTTNTDRATLVADDGYQWSVMDYYGNLWYAWDGVANGTSFTKGNIVFNAGNTIKDFRIGFHIVTNNTARLDGIKVYASNDKSEWTEISYRVSSTTAVGERFKAYIYADLTENVDYSYIKLVMNPEQSFWQGIDPGVYGFEYNALPIVNADSAMADSYAATISPDSNTEKAEFISDEGYQWSTMDWYGNLWYAWDGISANSTSYTKGSIIFDTENRIDNFRIRFHILSDKVARLDGIKVHVSSDKSNWVNVDYKISETTAAGNRYKIYLYVDLADNVDFRYIKLVMNPEQSSWHGIDPGVYGMDYNVLESTDNEPEIPDEPTPVYELGDVNLDGEVNILDLVRLKKNLINHDFKYTAAADIDANGFVNSADLICLRKILLEVPLVFDDTSTEPEIHGDVIENTYSTTAYSVLDDDLSDYSKIYQKNMNGSIATSYASDIGDSYRLGVTSAEAAESDNNVVWYLEDGFTEYCVETLRNDADAVEDNFTVFVSKDGQTWDEQSVTPEIKVAGAASWKHLYYSATGLSKEYKFLKIQFPVAKNYYALAIGRVRLNGISYMDELTANYENRASATFYVDSVYGSDDNHGMSKNAPFKTLAKVSSKYYQEGDKILFKRGTSYNGTLRIKGHGDVDNEIYVGTYGSGAAPAIYSNGNFAVTLEAYNITLDGLDITNPNGIVGVHIVPLVNGENPNVTVKNCNIHDIHSNISDTTILVRGEGGIIVSTATAEASYFNGLTLENNTIKNVNTSGIFVNNHWDNDKSLPQLWGTEAGKPHQNVTIKGNYLDAIGVDGIMVAMSKNVLIENNTLYRAYQCTADNFNNGAGIWVINCDDNVIQYNEVGYMDRKDGQIDGEAFDIDIGCKNTTLQYNYSHDNVGGFLLMCTSYDFDYSTNAYTQDVTVRYNVSIGDGLLDSDEQGIIVISDNVANVDIYNNTIYMSGNARTLMPIKSVHAYFDGSIIDSLLGRNIYSTNINVFNNIFHAEEGIDTAWDMSKSKSVTFDNNIYSGNATAATNVATKDGSVSDSSAKVQDVTFTGNLAEILDGRDTALNLKPSTAISGATIIADNGGFDFNGEAIVDAFYGAIKN